MSEVLMDHLKNYKEKHCFQYDMRIKNRKEDIEMYDLTEEEISSMRTSDFEFAFVTDKAEQKRMMEFIKRHEWLGTIGQYPTHWLAAYYRKNNRNILSGVVIFSMPTFSKLLGDDTKDIERLIARGACISWSPKNLGSAMLAWGMKWMVKNTQYRLFTAYSDPSAKELGTIYQALNAYYLGQKNGARYKYINPYTGILMSDRTFRSKTFYKKYAKELNIDWQKNWDNKESILWENIPNDVEQKLREYSRELQRNSKRIECAPKHKYAFVLGKTKAETKKLRKLFESRNKIYEYPKERGK